MNDNNMSESRGNNVTMSEDRTVPEHHGLGAVHDMIGDLPGKFPEIASASVPVSAQKPRAAPDTFGAAIGPLDDVRVCVLPLNSQARVMNVEDAVASVVIWRVWIAPQAYQPTSVLIQWSPADHTLVRKNIHPATSMLGIVWWRGIGRQRARRGAVGLGECLKSSTSMFAKAIRRKGPRYHRLVGRSKLQRRSQSKLQVRGQLLGIVMIDIQLTAGANGARRYTSFGRTAYSTSDRSSSSRVPLEGGGPIVPHKVSMT